MAKSKHKKAKLSFFKTLVLIVTICLGIVLFLSSYAGMFDPRKFVLFAFIGLAYPFILFANVIVLVFWLLNKNWKVSLLIVAFVFSGYPTLFSTIKFWGEEGADLKTTDHLRIMTYNVHNFKKFGDKNDLETKRNFLSVLKEQNPDIILFQEFYTRFKGEYNLVDSIKVQLKTPYTYFKSSKENDYEAMGLAIFSKYPLKNKDFIPFDAYGANGCLLADVIINNKKIRIFNLHLKSISFGNEDYQYLDQVKEINPDKQSSKRIYRALRSAFKKRAENIDLLKKEIAKCNTPYILAGDFNDTPASFAVKQLTNNLNNAFFEKGIGMGVTYNGKFPNFQIDYIATTKDLQIVNYKVTKAKLSDHYPVRSDIEILP
ncbi:endonuclease/exonuclease/phosphatase family protein [Pedobacter flavus]|uniref:Endonuclease/exonuclease/phosphatase family protein n=1 Tax=Pedobacter flavus TaxID=3113906 RepID=A0ABU7GYA4_9SPHI|nr:endonuclease/exonuclease/phosphatase family protein [Pedobacter sp. VNH31]MEE1884068.1 endonuclease/exonuclease/phosphatase family protein [Pedobacter sp. VNH31]